MERGRGRERERNRSRKFDSIVRTNGRRWRSEDFRTGFGLPVEGKHSLSWTSLCLDFSGLITYTLRHFGITYLQSSFG